MINVVRNEIADTALKNNKLLKASLANMSFGKCYLCEEKNPVSTEIEHFKSSSKHPKLKDKWENLFLACHHCNTIKNYKIDRDYLDILNCTLPSPIIKDEIKFLSVGCPKESLIIEAVNNDHQSEELKNTIFLLDNIFNSKTDGKEFDAKNLTDKVIGEVKRLLDNLHEFYNANSEDRKTEFRSKIKDQLSKESPFTAFKIWYIKSRSHLSDFEDLLPKF